MIKTFIDKILANTVKMATLCAEGIREACACDDECKVAVGGIVTILLGLGALFTHVFPSVITTMIGIVLYASVMIGGIINLVATISNNKPWLTWTDEFPAFILLIFFVTVFTMFFGFFAGLPLVFL